MGKLSDTFILTELKYCKVYKEDGSIDATVLNLQKLVFMVIYDICNKR